MQRIHRPLVEGVVQNLMTIFNQNQKADKVVELSLKENKKWGARDRRFVAENTYEVIRWWRLLKFCSEIDQRVIKEESLFWEMLGTWFVLSGLDLPDWEEFSALKPETILAKKKEAIEIRKIRESIPDWIDELGEAEVEEWEKELAALNEPTNVYLRVNTLVTNKKELLASLKKEGVELEEVEGISTALRLLKRRNLKALKPYNKGHFEIQDAGSQLISDYLEVLPGMKVIDACAGAGGKSLHMATLMQNKGDLISMDIKAPKLQELEKRAFRNKINIIRTEVIKTDNIKKRAKSADRVLLDVPCSGLGVLKRNPDAKWKLKEDFLEEIKEVQESILRNYAEMTKVGGKLVYATCSMLKSENEDQVARFLANTSDFELEKETRISPAQTGFDGFYMALIKRVS
ncbi:RsmB/NOP family class I SAM-dependent RNA methyltransferase [uncultured Arcticibacterium sp.]|uniref:RsmB/NOP family class I SAM-dependent RNA methyltransferase n=1 Tax=uncultured Arcticibacterium sp. TaxID=2173042 RepID=UPI0030F6E988